MRFKGILILFFLLCGDKAFTLDMPNSFDDFLAVPTPVSYPDASFNFPGCETTIGGSFCAMGWSEPFGMSELARTSIIAGYGAEKLGISVAFNGSGFDLYGEEQEKIGISVSPFKALSLGARLKRTGVRIKGFGTDDAFSADAGFTANYSGIIFVAGAFENIGGAEIGESGEELENTGRFSSAVKISDKLYLIASAMKTGDYPVSSGFGFTAKAGDVLDLGVIGANRPGRLEFICGVSWHRMKLSWRGNYQAELGISQGFSMSYTGD